MRISLAWSSPIASSRIAALAAVSGSLKLLFQEHAAVPAATCGDSSIATLRTTLHVAADVVLVARMDHQVDELVGLGRGDALLAAVDERVEAVVDRCGDLLADANRLGADG